jgi:PKD repeat protein
MSKSTALMLAFMLAAVTQSLAGTTIVPNTTLAAETGNNTSGADTWQTSPNGDVAPGNVSKESTRKLLYPGSTAKIYAHFIPWWGSSSHIDNGYNAEDKAQVKRQLDDMIGRGIDGLIIDWYGKGNTHIDKASQAVKAEAERRGGKFTFAIMEDQGSVRTCAYTAGCDVTQAVIDDFNYIDSMYASSPAYMRVNGRPVIFTFDTENLPNVDWNKVLANAQGNPMVVLRNDQGFRIWYTAGSYAWVAINKGNQSDWGQNYLVDFYWNSRNSSSGLVYPGVWKGFNDGLASWSEGRVMSQDCGQVWLQTFTEMNQAFSASHQATAVQLVTWNDYEEGTEIETGIDNCVSISGSVSGTDLYWNIGGQENTVDHYSVFISNDGQNLMKLTDVAPGTHRLPLASYGFAPGNYSVFVKAVGMPSMLNHMTPPIPVTIGKNMAPLAMLGVTPSSGIAPVTVSASTTASKDPDGTIVSTRIDFGDGTVVNAATGSHTYSAPGTYTVTATVTDNGGVSGTAKATVTVNAKQPPMAAISVTPASAKAPVTVTASIANSKDANGTIVSSTIDFGDGTVVAGPTATHTYNKPGSFKVTGTVKNNGGLAASASTSVSVTAAAAPFTVNVSSPTQNVVVGPVRFTATTSSPSPVTAMRIYVDNRSVAAANGPSIDQTLTLAPGPHYVVMQAWNQAGAIAKTPVNITVQNAPPAPALGVSVGRPTRGTRVSNPVAITATAASTTPIVAMRLYVDSTPVYNLNSFSTKSPTLDTTVTMTPGAHTLVVQGWDSTGKVYKTPVPITVR